MAAEYFSCSDTGFLFFNAHKLLIDVCKLPTSKMAAKLPETFI